MNTSSRFIVALHIMAFMAAKLIGFGKEAAGLVCSEELAQSVNTNPVFIRRVLSQLQKAGLVVSERGRNGGTMLALAPDRITLLDIYNAVEKRAVFHMHYGDPSPYCPVGANIQDAVNAIFEEAEDAMKQVLAGRTLESVAVEIIETSGVRALIDQGLTFEQIQAIMLEKAGMITT